MTPGQDAPDGLDRVVAAAQERGLPIEVVERPNARSLAEAAELIGVPVSGIVKTLVVRRGEGDYLFALVPGGRKISWPKLRAAVGVNRLALAQADQALAATGFERGTITPIGSRTALPVFADSSIVGRRVAMGSGTHDRSAFVNADALIASFGAVVADITDPE